MRLTRVLMYYVKRRHIPGKIDSGKHRLMPYINPNVKRAAMQAMCDEQRNLDVLGKTYLTEAEEQNHMEDMGFTPEYLAQQAIAERQARRWLKNRPMDEELNHLNVSKAWE